uniref:Major facilitator superfamily (MFS) profile domain-containing protein n=1 Tax=Thermosporothrix sp. COM3 TaxID=2490863 RepID=A0A455SK87_9CHLR|nr:hypothetical protein KTC_25390 [Thermosporothrix sp. COM3]
MLSRSGVGRRFLLARIAVSVIFFLNGFLGATFSVRLPAIQTKLSLQPGLLGLALLGCTVGGLLAMNVAGRLSGRVGSAFITVLATLIMGCSLPLIAYAPMLPLLVLALFLFGIGNGAMDVTMNTQGAAVERAYERPIMNSFHACFSVGSLVGATFGSLLAAMRLSPELHFCMIAICALLNLAWCSRFLVPEKPTQQERPARKGFSLRGSRTIILLGTIAFCSLLSIGAIYDWSAVYLSGTLHADAGLAASGFTIFLVCQTLGRSVGDKLATRFGAPVLVRISCALAAIGLLMALLFPWVPVALVGLGLVGIGLSVPFPLVVSAVGRLAGANTGALLSAISTWGYFGMIAGPPVIGFLADWAGLRVALVLVVCLCTLAALCASGTEKR